MFDVKKITRKNVLELRSYSSARDEFTGEAETFLDANENPYGFGLNRYPDASMKVLKQAFGAYRGIDGRDLMFGNGSDELIDLIIRAFCEPGKDKILVFDPTFDMYAVAAAINNVEIIREPLTADFQIDFEALQPQVDDERLKVIFICSPNNPTGNSIPKDRIITLANSFQGLVVVDEAYVDFADSTLINENVPNLVILQTFSKAIGLAGIRLGVGIGDPEVIEILNKIKPPYNVNELTQKEALAALSRPEEIKKQVSNIVNERSKMSEILTGLPMVRKVFPSNANFLLVQFDDAKKVYDQLVSKGIVVRNKSRQVSGALRITVGTSEENSQLIAALRGVDFKSEGRIGSCVRSTSETQIKVKVNLDDPSNSSISTGIPFFDHMLEQLARHGQIGLQIESKGDLVIDAHHTIEDTALALGTAFNDALGNRKGIERYGFLLPMDDSLAQVAIDFGGRPWIEWDASFKSSNLGDMPTDMVFHFFKSFSDMARCNINVKAEGANDHHQVEAIFKAFAKAVRMAVNQTGDELPSTKGVL